MLREGKEMKVPNLIIIDLQNKEATRGQDVQSLIGCSEAQDWFIRVQAGHLLLGNLAYLTALLPVEEDGFHRRWLSVDE